MHTIVKKPMFVGWLAFVIQLPIQIIMTFWFSGFVGGVSKSMGFTYPGFYLVLGVIAFVAVPCVTIFGKQMSYAWTTYSFFDDHVEVQEGFLTRQMKSVAFGDVREVTLRRGALQRLCGSARSTSVRLRQAPARNSIRFQFWASNSSRRAV